MLQHHPEKEHHWRREVRYCLVSHGRRDGPQSMDWIGKSTGQDSGDVHGSTLGVTRQWEGEREELRQQSENGSR